jgi:excisionase family DNA binding protein
VENNIVVYLTPELLTLFSSCIILQGIIIKAIRRVKMVMEPIKEKKEPVKEKGVVDAKQLAEIEAGGYMTPKQVAEDFHYSKAYIIGLLKAGRIHGTKPMGGQWRIPISEVTRIRGQGIPPLPPKPKPPDATEVVVEGKHLERVQPAPVVKQEPTKKGSGILWPLNIIFRDRDEEDETK